MNTTTALQLKTLHSPHSTPYSTDDIYTHNQTSTEQLHFETYSRYTQNLK